eukprot:6887193-Karenia_brevis.AAC.1
MQPGAHPEHQYQHNLACFRWAAEKAFPKPKKFRRKFYIDDHCWFSIFQRSQIRSLKRKLNKGIVDASKAGIE